MMLCFEKAHLRIHHKCNFSADLLSKAKNNHLNVFSEFVSTCLFVVSQLLVDI
jgi:hypothetical protein